MNLDLTDQEISFLLEEMRLSMLEGMSQTNLKIVQNIITKFKQNDNI